MTFSWEVSREYDGMLRGPSAQAGDKAVGNTVG